MRKLLSSVLVGSGLAFSIASSASAHISLLDPPPRYVPQGEVGIKSCPCGLGGSNRICNVAQDGSDPDRSDSVTRFEAGSTITIKFNEFVNHSGRFRVAFDPDGADVADFNAHILMDVPDPNNADGMDWELTVKLPDQTCENCTLQLVQAMNGDMVDPVTDPSTTSSYYACADIELVAPGTLGNGSTPADPGAPGDQNGTQPPSGAQPPSGTPPTTPAQPPSNGQPAPVDDGTDDGDDDDSQQSGSAAGTPLIPTTPQPADSSSATGSATTPPSATTGGMVAMNTPGASPAVPGVTNTNMLPDLGTSPPSSSSGGGGCSLGSSGTESGAFGLCSLGLLAAVGLRRQRARKS